MAGGEADAADEWLSALARCLRTAGGRVVAVTRLPARRLAATDRPPLLAAAGAVDGAPWRPTALHGDLELRASATSGFHGSPLDQLLREIGCSDLLVAGWGLEGPVHSTLRAANDRGYECLLVPDACTTLQPELGFSACEMVRFSGGIFGAFADAADVIDALAATAEGATTNRST
jgi:nicotinamidase-related amidase